MKGLVYISCILLLCMVNLLNISQACAQIYGRGVLLKGRILAENNDSASISVKQQAAMPLSNATVQLLALPDSTFAAGGISNSEGYFRVFFARKQLGISRFLLKISYLGMETWQQELHASVKEGEMELGNLTLHPKVMTMQEAQIVGELKKMYMKGDTLVYNTDAYKMPEGSVLLELVRRLPGLYFSSSGQLMYLDKPISEIRLNGEGFFTHDLNIALKNVPVKELDQVKVYETVTEEDRMRGNDEKKQVMDMKTKKDVNVTMLANLTVGVANRDKRYLLDGGVNFFKKKGPQISLNGNMLNLPGSYNPERPDQPMSMQQDNSKEWIRKKVRFNWKQGFKNLSLNEDLSHNYYTKENETENSAENYLLDSSLFTERQSRDLSRHSEVNSRTILMNRFGGTSLMFIGSIKNAHGHSFSNNTSASFSQNPYLYSSQPLESQEDELADISTNRTQQQSLQRVHSKSAGGGLSLHKFMSGKHYLINLNASYAEKQGNTLTQSSTRFFLSDSVADRHQYVETPAQVLDLNAEFSYSFRIQPQHEIALDYILQYVKEKQRRTTYDLNLLADDIEWSIVPPSYASVRVDSISRNSIVRNILHDLELKYKGNFSTAIKFLGSVTFAPRYMHANTVTPVQTIANEHYTFLNWETTAELQYQSGLSMYTLSYKGESKEPSVSDLLPITNDDDPLNIISGNPNLKPSVTHSMSFYFRYGYAWNISLSASRTSRAFTTKTWYDEQTGARYTQPANISGNWKIMSMIDYKNSWKEFTLLCQGRYGYSNEARYVQEMQMNGLDERGDIRQQKGFLKTELRYTPQKIEIGLVLQCDLTHSHNQLTQNNLFTKDYTTTGNFRAYLPANIEVNTSFAYRLRRGYQFTSANLDESVWNIGIRYKFLKKKTASLQLDCFDLLKQKKSVSYYASGSNNNETRVNCISRYVLLTFSYRFNVFN